MVKSTRQIGLTLDADQLERIRRLAGTRSIGETIRTLLSAALDQADHTDEATAAVQRAAAAFAAELNRLGKGKPWTHSARAHAAMQMALTRFIGEAFPAPAEDPEEDEEDLFSGGLRQQRALNWGDPFAALDPTTLAAVLVSTFMAQTAAPPPPAPKVKPRRPRKS
jgi:hypothetical protein